jgi:glutamate formiminotransferase / 5-formyltetrahydrofolate cyclo-ligase
MTIPAPGPLLLAVPNVSEGVGTAALAASLAPVRVLDVHSDADHGRSVFTAAGRQGELAPALARLAAAAVERLDLRRHEGLHPHVGVLDVAPIVYPTPAARGAACAEALTAAAMIASEAGLPVFLYGELATDPSRRERAALRAGGVERLRERFASGELTPDYGPARVDPAAGAVLVAARPPLVAFNVELVSADVERARGIAARLRESGGGLPGVRAIGLYLPARGRAQVSVNVHDPHAVPLAEIVAFVAREAEVAEAELVGLAPRAALAGFPNEVRIRGFDPGRQLLENALGSVGG